MNPNTIKITTDIIEATDANSTRYALHSIKHYPATHAPQQRPAYLVASDGKIAAIVPVESTIEHADIIPREVIPQLVKHWPKPDSAGRFDEKKFPEITWTEGTRVYDSPAGKQCPSTEGRYPKIETCIPSLGFDPPAAVVALNADCLARLAAAITTHGDARNVTLIIPTARDARHVYVLGHDGFGVIMPLEPDRNSPLADAPRKYADQLAQFQATAETRNRPPA